MSYEMTGQNMTYPYPPPAAPPVATKPRKQFSKWWPISFFIAAVIFFIIGGGLFGGWTASAYKGLYSRGKGSGGSSSSYTGGSSSYTGSSGSSSSSSTYSYRTGNMGLFYGAIACLALGGICKLIAWILLIVFCVKRSARQVTAVAYNYQPLTYANVPTAPTAAVPAYQGAPAYAGAPPYPHSPSPAPPHSKEQPAMMRYCSQCGTGTTTPFCSRCGIAV